MGLVHNFSGLMAARWFLGLAEAGLFPGISYYLSCWYKRSEFGVRMAIFFSAAALAGSFGGLLAAAIANMDGVGGKAGWSWIFILEGLATIVLGVLSFWIVVDFPDQATFLSDADRKRVARRLTLDQQASGQHEEWKTSYLWDSLKDWKTYLGAIIYMGADGPLYAFSLFIPTIINELVSFFPSIIEKRVLTISGILIDQSATSHRPAVRGCCNSDCAYWLHRRSHTSKRALQYLSLYPRCSRFLDAPRSEDSRHSVRRCFSRCDGNLSLYCKHDFLDR